MVQRRVASGPRAIFSQFFELGVQCVYENVQIIGLIFEWRKCYNAAGITCYPTDINHRLLPGPLLRLSRAPILSASLPLLLFLLNAAHQFFIRPIITESNFHAQSRAGGLLTIYARFVESTSKAMMADGFYWIQIFTTCIFDSVYSLYCNWHCILLAIYSNSVLDSECRQRHKK